MVESHSLSMPLGANEVGKICLYVYLVVVHLPFFASIILKVYRRTFLGRTGGEGKEEEA